MTSSQKSSSNANDSAASCGRCSVIAEPVEQIALWTAWSQVRPDPAGVFREAIEGADSEDPRAAELRGTLADLGSRRGATDTRTGTVQHTAGPTGQAVVPPPAVTGVVGNAARVVAQMRPGFHGCYRKGLELNPDALAIADQMDAERRTKGPRGPLHGIPMLIKDNIDTADRMHTSAGSLALADSIAARDAFLAERLRAAGAVILGKTNLSEWANIRSTHSASGWSGRGGQCRNPYVLDRSPSGSSSGSGAAVAANLCAVAVGTETDGSITSPASAYSRIRRVAETSRDSRNRVEISRIVGKEARASAFGM